MKVDMKRGNEPKPFEPVLISISIENEDVLEAFRYFSLRSVTIPECIKSNTEYGNADRSVREAHARVIRELQHQLSVQFKKFPKRED